MDSTRFARLMELDRTGQTEEVIREAQGLLSETTTADERASALINLCVSYAKLGRLAEARQALEQTKRLEISHLGIRLNAEFCEPTLLMQEGKYEDGLSGFAAMLNRNREALKDPEHRYLYEDIQCRRALTLVGLSRYKEALPILREAASFSFDQVADEQQVHFALGVCLEDTNDPEAAKQQFTNVISYGLNNDIEERALYRLAILYFKAGALAQAKQQLETILSRESEDQAPAVPRKQVYQGLARTYHSLGDSANANHYAELAKRA